MPRRKSEEGLLGRERERTEEKANVGHEYDSAAEERRQFEDIAANARVQGYNRHTLPNETSIGKIKQEVADRESERELRKVRKRAGQYIKYSPQK